MCVLEQMEQEMETDRSGLEEANASIVKLEKELAKQTLELKKSEVYRSSFLLDIVCDLVF